MCFMNLFNDFWFVNLCLITGNEREKCSPQIIKGIDFYHDLLVVELVHSFSMFFIFLLLLSITQAFQDKVGFAMHADFVQKDCCRHCKSNDGAKIVE